MSAVFQRGFYDFSFTECSSWKRYIASKFDSINFGALQMWLLFYFDQLMEHLNVIIMK